MTSNVLDKNHTRISYDFTLKLFPHIKQDLLNKKKKKKDKKILFNEKLFEFYKNLYFSVKDFNQTNEFKLSNAFYKYIKLIAVLKKSEEATQLIEEALSMSEETAQRKFYSREYHEKIEKINTFSKSDINNVNKNKELNMNGILFDNKKMLRLKKKSTDISKLNESELIEMNINKIMLTTEKNPLSNTKVYNSNIKSEDFSSLIKENINEFNKDSIEHYFIIKFFESITTSVEVRNEEEINQIVIFTQPPEIIFLSNGTKSEFEREVNRDSETSKKNDLIRNAAYFKKEIKYYQRKQSKLHRWISKIDFLYVQELSYIYSLIFNLLILLTLDGDKVISIDNDKKGIRSRRINKKKIELSIDRSIEKWKKIYDLICYVYVGANGFFIILWIFFRLPLYYKIDRLKYMEINNIQNKKQLNIFQKIYIIIKMTIYERSYISTLIYEFIFSLIGALMERGEIIYAFLLLPIIDLNNILKNIIISMKLQYNAVCLTFFFAAMMMYVFSNLIYFFFNEDYSQEIEYQNDNVCQNLIFCFMNTLDSGLRARGGIGDSAIRLSYCKHKVHYIKRLIVDDLFFLLIVIIAIDLVFGIILGAFTILRHKEQRHRMDKINRCFICHANKNAVEKNMENFNEHRTKTHNLWNYVYYMITLQLSNQRDLTAINSYAIKKIENKDISWMPTFKDLNCKGKNDDFEEELKVQEENINKYIAKAY